MVSAYRSISQWWQTHDLRGRSGIMKDQSSTAPRSSESILPSLLLPHSHSLDHLP